MTNMAITRRGFMKAAATATAALGVAGAPVLLDEVDQAFADSIPQAREAQDGVPWLYQLLPRLRVHRGRCGGED